MVWEKTFGGSNNDIGNSFQQTTDGGYIITGSTSSFGEAGLYLIKTDSNGNLLWDKAFGGPSYGETGYSVQQTNDGGYIVVGRQAGSGGMPADVYLVYYKTDGWTLTYPSIPLLLLNQ